jgi:twinkle protein
MTKRTWADVGIALPFGASGEVKITCPECTPGRKRENQRDKDLRVNVEEGVWFCHHCGWTGSLTQGEKDWRDTPPSRKPTYDAPRPLPQVTIPTLWDNAVKWFAERAIPETVLLAKGVTAAKEFCPVCNGEVGHILFPYYVDGQHINTKHRCGKKHFRMEKGAQRVLYNVDTCRDADTIVIVEGEIDALSCHVAGYPATVSVPDGAPALDAKNYQSKFTFLEAAEALFQRVKTVIIATDADAPGQKLMEELARRIGPEKCSRVIWPEGIKDANECLQSAGADYLKSCLDEAEPFPVEGIYTGRNLISDLEHLYLNGSDPGVEFGRAALDAHYRVKTGLMTVATGIPGHGKSSVIDQLLIWLAERHGWTFALFSPEQQPLVKHQQHLIELYTGKPFTDGPRPRMSLEEMRAANLWVADRFAFLLPDEPGVDTILELAKVQVFRNGVRGIVVDPWNELEHSRPRHQSETEYISDALSKFRRFARLHNVHLWLVAHPTKMRRTDEGEEPVPGLWDISGSAHFRNKADIGLTVWRDLAKNDDTVEIHITKMRFNDQGQLGKVRFGYDRASKRLFEISQGAA